MNQIELKNLDSNDLEAPLLNISTDVRELLEDFIHECQHIDEFYQRQKNREMNEFNKFYEKFTSRVSDDIRGLDLKADLKEHGLDGLGYSSSWARQFIEFYSKFSWLDGFAKINCIAVQKILKKFDKLIFHKPESRLTTKLENFIKMLKLSHPDGCSEQRLKIRDKFAKHY